MTAAQGLYAEGQNVTASSTTWVDVCEIAAASFTASAKYLILASVLVRHASGTNDVRLRLVRGGTPTVFTDASVVYEVRASTQTTNVGWMYPYTQPGTTELVKLQVSSSSTSTVTVDLGQIFALKLDDIGTEDTDYRHNEVTADYTTTSSYVAQASETWTPNGTDNYLVIAHGVITGVSATTSHLMRLNDSVAGVLAGLDVEGEDATNEIRSYLLMAAYTPSNASHTLSVQFAHETSAHTVLSSRIFVLNLAKFRQNSFSYAAAEEAPAASPSWTTTRTLAPTPDVTGDWFIWGALNNDINVDTDTANIRMQVNAGGGGLVSDPNYGDDAPNQDNWDNTDVMPWNIFNMVSLTSGASRTINLDVQMTAGTGWRVENRCLVAFSLELPSVAPTISVDTLTLAGSAPNMSVAPGAVSPTMNALTLAGSVPNMSVSATVAVLMDVLNLASSPPTLTVMPGAVTPLMDVLTLASSIPDLTVVLGGGASTITMDVLTLVGSVPNMSVSPGAVASAMDALTLSGSAPNMSVSPGAVVSAMDALTLAGNAPDMSVTPGAVVIAANVLTLGSTPMTLTVVVTGAVALDALTLAASVPNLAVVPGAVAVNLDALSLASSALDMTVLALILSVTPADRIFAVDAESRLFAIAYEGRVYVVDSESRFYAVDAEDRAIPIDQELRVLAVSD